MALPPPPDVESAGWKDWLFRFYKLVLAGGGSPLTFTAPTLLNSWANVGAGYSAAGYAITADGIVCLRGLITGGSGVTAVMFTLPVGYRPAADQLMAISANGAFAALYIKSNGDVAQAVGSVTNASLSGVTFSTAA